MEPHSEQWLRPRRARDEFPPYELADRDIVSVAQERTRALSRIYHVATDQAWDGRKVLAELIEKYGGVHFPDDKKQAMGRVASVLLWGELAAWSISADLALRLRDTEAKMAASSQVFDEARHFYVLRDYLWAAGIEVPRLGGYTRTLLVGLLETDNLLHKLVGMQLLVENTALSLFKMIAAARIEPVLSDLLYYFERDEARHVGLGVMTLPRALTELSDLDTAKLWLYQVRVNLLTLAGGLTMRDAFAQLGVDQQAMQLYAFRLQTDVYKRMKKLEEDRPRADGIRGLFKVSREGQARINGFLFPKGPRDSWPRWQSTALSALIAAADRGDRWLSDRAR